MPDGSPARTPIPVETPTVSPERERRADPEKLCPAQKETLTRTISPYLPEQLVQVTADKEKQKECTSRTIDWLHQVWLLLENNRPIQPNPFYERNKKLTPTVVDAVINNIEELFKKEFKNYPGYHNNAQGISQGEKLVPPGFDSLDSQTKLAIVQGIDKIFQDYKPVTV